MLYYPNEEQANSVSYSEELTDFVSELNKKNCSFLRNKQLEASQNNKLSL